MAQWRKAMHAVIPTRVHGGRDQYCVPNDAYHSVGLLLSHAQTSLSGDPDSTRLLLSRALTILQQDEASSKGKRASLAKWQIQRLDNYIDTHLGSRIRTEHLAAVLKLSPRHFSHSFKATLGLTPLHYVANRRIESACRTMLTTDFSLTDIAYSYGFCDQSHFIRIFRRQIGITPHAWRRLGSLNPQHSTTTEHLSCKTI